MSKNNYVCPFCAADLSKQDGFNPSEKWKCAYCGNEVYMNSRIKTGTVNSERLWRKAKPVAEILVGLTVLAIGTAVTAAEFFIRKSEKSGEMDIDKQ